MKTVLVAYASKHSSTAEIANTIGEWLKRRGLEAQVWNVDLLHEVDKFDAVVIGSAVYAGNWLAPAVSFLEVYADRIAGKDVWLFSSGPTGEGNANELLDGWAYPQSLQPYVEKLQPHDIRVFHGKVDVKELGWGERFIFKAVGKPSGDFRNWGDIRRWADTIADKLLMPVSS